MILKQFVRHQVINIIILNMMNKWLYRWQKYIDSIYCIYLPASQWQETVSANPGMVNRDFTAWNPAIGQ